MSRGGADGAEDRGGGGGDRAVILPMVCLETPGTQGVMTGTWVCLITGELVMATTVTLPTVSEKKIFICYCLCKVLL